MNQIPGLTLDETLGKLGDWNVFEKPPPVDESAAQARYDLDVAYKRCFSTEVGRRVLEDLINKTLRQPTFDANLGWQNGAARGFAREGQNSIVAFIMECMARAEQGPPNVAKDTKPRRKAPAAEVTR